jgi:hypothetical protein
VLTNERDIHIAHNNIHIADNTCLPRRRTGPPPNQIWTMSWSGAPRPLRPTTICRGVVDAGANEETGSTAIGWTDDLAGAWPNMGPLEDTMTDAGLEITPDALDGGAVNHYFIDGITGGWLYKNDGTTLITKDTPITAAEGAAGLKFMPLANLNTAAADAFQFTVADVHACSQRLRHRHDDRYGQGHRRHRQRWPQRVAPAPRPSCPC